MTSRFVHHIPGLLRSRSGLPAEVYRGCSTLQRALLQEHRTRRNEDEGFETCAHLYHPGIGWSVQTIEDKIHPKLQNFFR